MRPAARAAATSGGGGRTVVFGQRRRRRPVAGALVPGSWTGGWDVSACWAGTGPLEIRTRAGPNQQ